MEYVKFSLVFVLSHVLAYTIAGAIALKISKDIYEDKNRLCGFLRDMSDAEESRRVAVYFFPAQIVRGLLMAVVLFPTVNYLGEQSFALKVAFFSGLMFVYTHIAAASPFIDNIEGSVYFKRDYIKKKSFLKFQLEMVLYSVLFGLLMALFMILV